MNNIHLKIMDLIDGFVEYKRNLNDCITFIEEENTINNTNNTIELQGEEFNQEKMNIIKGLNLEGFIKKNLILKEKFKKKNTKINLGDFIMVKILKHYVKLNNQVLFICDFDSEKFEIIQ
jgi:hypothetical protein